MEKIIHFKNLLQYSGIFLLMIGTISCNSDDEIINQPSGKIEAEDLHNLAGNILKVPKVTVEQKSWLAAVEFGEELTNNFIAQPVMIEKGTSNNVELTFEEANIDYLAGYQQIVLKLYADNPTGGIMGEWDLTDPPITYSNKVLVTKIITIIPDLTGFDPFNYFDRNNNGTLDVDEVSRTYSFELISSNNNPLTLENFYTIMYHTTNEDYYDAGITQEEWEDGYSRMFSNRVQNKFSTYDLDNTQYLDIEEWNKVFIDSDWFESYDINSDNILSEEEINNGFFNDWDYNQDGNIDKEEFLKYRVFSGRLSTGNYPM